MRLVIVGDGPYRETLQKRMPQATFLGYRSGPELSAIYASADLFVFPGLADTFGQVVLEAAASGLPAVVSAGVAVDEIIERGKTALTVAPGDAEGFAAAMETLLDDDERRRQMGDAARRRALTRSWAVTFDGVWDAYRDLDAVSARPESGDALFLLAHHDDEVFCAGRLDDARRRRQACPPAVGDGRGVRPRRPSPARRVGRGTPARPGRRTRT